MADSTLDNYTAPDSKKPRKIVLEGPDSERKREFEAVIQTRESEYLNVDDKEGILHLVELAEQNNYKLTFNDLKHILNAPMGSFVANLDDLELAGKIIKHNEGLFVTYTKK